MSFSNQDRCHADIIQNSSVNTRFAACQPKKNSFPIITSGMFLGLSLDFELTLFAGRQNIKGGDVRKTPPLFNRAMTAWGTALVPTLFYVHTMRPIWDLTSTGVSILKLKNDLID